MCTKAVRVLILFLLLKFATPEKGFVAEYFEGKKFEFPGTKETIYSVKSEIQCAHRCLQHKNCELLNYNIDSKAIQNCEIFTEMSTCATMIENEAWKAIQFKVGVWFQGEHSERTLFLTISVAMAKEVLTTNLFCPLSL